MKPSTIGILWTISTIVFTAVAFFILGHATGDVTGYNEGIDDGNLFLQEGQNTCEMRFPNKGIDKINGLYSHPDYICVWTRNRDTLEITETWEHEMAHLYNWRDPKHFGKDDMVIER